MDKMSFYYGIEDFKRIKSLIPKRKGINEEINNYEIFKYKSKYEGEKDKQS